MIGRLLALIMVLAGSACSPDSKVRQATVDETRAIYWEIASRFSDDKSGFCFSREIAPVLEHQKGMAESFALIRRSRGRSQVSDDQIAMAQSWDGINSSKPLTLEEGLGLERALAQAVNFKVDGAPLPSPEAVLPNDQIESVNAKADIPCGRPGMTEIFLSQPIIVGDTAFVETGGVCGGLCGSGAIEAYKFERGKWRLFAQHMTWVS